MLWKLTYQTDGNIICLLATKFEKWGATFLCLDINGENCFLKQNFSFLTPSDHWKPDKSLKPKSCDAGNPPHLIQSLIIEYPHIQREIEWVKNSETGRYKTTGYEDLEDQTSLGSPVLWKDPKTQRFYVIGVVDKEEETFLPRLFGMDDLRNFGKFVIIFICFDQLKY